jgi:hypothetical protein
MLPPRLRSGPIAGIRTYVKKGSGRWVIGNLTAKAQADDEHALNPYASLAMFGKLPGVRWVSPGHYSATGPFTVAVLLDAGGRPVEITASGGSASNVFAATETFAHYNKPVTITAPQPGMSRPAGQTDMITPHSDTP